MLLEIFRVIKTPLVLLSQNAQAGSQEQPANEGPSAGRQWSALFPVNGHDLSIANPSETNLGNVKISFDDIKGEVDFWVNAIVCHVVGANPPLHVMEGFLKRVWGKYGIGRVSLISKGIFIV